MQAVVLSVFGVLKVDPWRHSVASTSPRQGRVGKERSLANVESGSRISASASDFFEDIPTFDGTTTS